MSHIFDFSQSNNGLNLTNGIGSAFADFGGELVPSGFFAPDPFTGSASATVEYYTALDEVVSYIYGIDTRWNAFGDGTFSDFRRDGAIEPISGYAQHLLSGFALVDFDFSLTGLDEGFNGGGFIEILGIDAPPIRGLIGPVPRVADQGAALELAATRIHDALQLAFDDVQSRLEGSLASIGGIYAERWGTGNESAPDVILEYTPDADTSLIVRDLFAEGGQFDLSVGLSYAYLNEIFGYGEAVEFEFSDFDDEIIQNGSEGLATLKLNLRDGNDSLSYGQLNDEFLATTLQIDAGRGDDSLNVLINAQGMTTLFGGDGNDSIFVHMNGTSSDSHATVYGGAGNDEITANGSIIASYHGGDGQDTIAGSNQDDTVTGGSGNDRIYTLDGADTVTDGDGIDAIALDAGNDIAMLTGTTYHTSEYVAFNASSATQTGTHVQINLEGLLRLETVTDGGADFDVVQLGDQGDAFFLHDAYSGFHTSVALTEDSFGNDSAARFSGIEEIRGMGGDDIIDLTSPDYSLAGLSMLVDGGAGNDTIWGSDANDNIFGGAGNDVIFGGAGTNVLTGGLGADVFEFTRSSTNTSVTDFDITEGDMLRFYNTGGAEFDSSSLRLTADGFTISYTDTTSGIVQDVSISLASDGADFTTTLIELQGALDII
ncbi:calcium-binding protein [Cochlodiniinecator piscidefendens]|uniref:calcium-binding protein n=1 Tax=Cochlodiniinecator piscidefendens TaxID=2715756 RepID=UPI00197B6E2C|nr:calcium-binding protein [Cochlodiniinecator piscidefendens]